MTSGKLLGWSLTIFIMITASYCVMTGDNETKRSIIGLLSIMFPTAFFCVAGGKAFKRYTETKKGERNEK